MIDSLDKLEGTALEWGLLPFFSNEIKGFSVQEQTAPGFLLSDDGEECWMLKCPVIGRQSVSYGKFFRKKAGFVSLSLFPDFLNYRRWRYPVLPGSTDSMILDIIKENEGLTSTELKGIIFGRPKHRKVGDNLVGVDNYVKPKRHSLEGALQRLQMGGHILIADFQYKLTRRGERYGWGVALYSTPEIWFDKDFSIKRTPEDSFKDLVDSLNRKMPGVSRARIEKLLL